ncbi:MAG: hypothetical protein NXI10_07830 [bacterium]|nr:hypothetical protein [bacterium]
MIRNLLFCISVLGGSVFAQNNSIFPENLQRELKKLDAAEFQRKNLDTLLIDPITLSPAIYNDPFWWSEIQEKYNYREDQIPRTIRYTSADPENFTSNNPKDWSDDYFYPLESYTLLKNGYVIEHVYLDSTVFFYNERNQMCLSRNYTYDSKPNMESAQLYHYDAHGNVLWTAWFNQSASDVYLNEYETFNYLPTDSGFYLRRDHYYVYDTLSQDHDHSRVYTYYNKQGRPMRSYEKSSFGDSSFSQFVYSELGTGEKERVKTTFRIILDEYEVRDEQVTRIDQKGREIISKSTRFGGSFSYTDMDSTIYRTDQEVQLYNQTPHGVYKNSLIETQLDTYGNVLRREIYDLNSETPEKIEILTETQLFYLKNGTWNYQILNQTYWDGSQTKEYYKREFLNQPISSFDPKFKEDSFLLELIEKSIPAEKR